MAIIATIQVPVTASLNTNFNTDGSCATASGWLAILRPNANVSPITRIFRSLNPALEIIFIPLIRIIPKTVMIAPPSTAFGIAEKIAPSFWKNPAMVIPEVFPMVSSPDVTNNAAKLMIAGSWNSSLNCIGSGIPNHAASEMADVSIIPRNNATI